ncbi:uncharacterized protein TNCV_4747941 [Trichonephila clavipes]|nr:uncharacterized protein TNCV_4747941 [Trichonephila clavipes]
MAKGRPVVIRSFQHHTSDTTIWLVCTPILTWGGQGPPTCLPFPPTSREDLRLDGYLENPQAVKALYIYKHLCLLRDLNRGSKAQQSVSLTTIPDGRPKTFVR